MHVIIEIKAVFKITKDEPKLKDQKKKKKSKIYKNHN